MLQLEAMGFTALLTVVLVPKTLSVVLGTVLASGCFIL